MTQTKQIPVARIVTPAGSPAWHVTGHPEAKALLADERIGMSHPHPARAPWYTTDDVSGRPRGGSESEYAEHAVWRKAMNRVFSPAQLARSGARAAEFAETLVDDMLAAGPTADLNARYAVPLCSAVILTVLGLPDDDMAQMQQWTEEGATTGDVGRSLRGMQALLGYASRLVRERRGGDGTDAVSELLRSASADPSRVIKLVAGMLAFGRETPASALSNGILLLLRHPDQLRLVRDDPDRTGPAVEEMLRMFHPPAATPDGLLRYANADVEAGGVLIRRGEMVLIDIAKANFDERAFGRPDRFDATRAPNPHLTFGSGFYMCNFAKLARIELGAAVRVLLARVPGLRLAVAPSELRYKTHLRTNGIESLPVAW